MVTAKQILECDRKIKDSTKGGKANLIYGSEEAILRIYDYLREKDKETNNGNNA